MRLPRHADVHGTALTPKSWNWQYSITCYLYIYPEYKFPVLYILNSLVLTVKMENNSHGDYKNTASRVECKLHENTLLTLLMLEEKTRGLVVFGTPPACARTYTHPNADLNAHIWKYQYIFFRHPTLYRKTKKIPIIIITPLFIQLAKSQKVLFKNCLWLFVIYTLCFSTMTMMV